RPKPIVLVRGRRRNGKPRPKAPSHVTVAHLHSAIEIQARIRELIKLAKEQGYLTFDDLNEALPEGISYAVFCLKKKKIIRHMEIDMIEAAVGSMYKEGTKDAEGTEGADEQQVV